MSADEPRPEGRRGFASLLNIAPHEVRAAWTGFAYFGCLLGAYYILRPIREELGVAGGVRNLPWLFTGTFVATLFLVPIFSFMVSRWPRRRFVPATLGFFAANLAVFYALTRWAPRDVVVQSSRAFFVWVSVFNIFVCSLFWSHMVDVFSREQGRRLFGFLAGGGTVGAIIGSAFTAIVVEWLPTDALMLPPIMLLVVAILLGRRLDRLTHAARGVESESDAEPLRGGVVEGFLAITRSRYLFGIASFMFLAVVTGTIIYHQQNELTGELIPDRERRTQLFATINLVTQCLIAAIDIFVTARVIRWFGVSWCLALVAIVNAALFVSSGLHPALWMVAGADILRRTVGFALGTPSRELLFTVVSRDAKYKAKSFIDNVVFRGGDVLSSWTYRVLSDAGFTVATFSWYCLPVCAAWAGIGFGLGRLFDRTAGIAERNDAHATHG